MGNIKIKFEGRIGFGLHADEENFLNSLKQLCSTESDSRISIDFSDVTFIYPSGIIAIVVVGMYLIDTNKCRISNNMPRNIATNDFLDYSGFMQIVGLKKETKKVPTLATYAIKNIDHIDDNAIESLIDVIQTELACSIPSRGRIHENIAELILNVLQHSKSPIDCYIIGQAYPTTHRIRYCIADAGIGIKEHLSNNYPELKNKNSCEAIEFATIEGVTGAKGNTNSGLGLSDLRELVQLLGGSFTILSGDGLYEEIVCYAEKNKTPQISKKKIPLEFLFQGTLVDIRLDSQPGYKLFQKEESMPDNYKMIR